MAESQPPLHHRKLVASPKPTNRMNILEESTGRVAAFCFSWFPPRPGSRPNRLRRLKHRTPTRWRCVASDSRPLSGSLSARRSRPQSERRDSSPAFTNELIVFFCCQETPGFLISVCVSHCLNVIGRRCHGRRECACEFVIDLRAGPEEDVVNVFDLLSSGFE